MYCVRKVTDDLYWVGANDHRTTLFENIHPIPKGVSYNAYLLLDEETVLFDTVDWSVCRQMMENLEYLSSTGLRVFLMMAKRLGSENVFVDNANLKLHYDVDKKDFINAGEASSSVKKVLRRLRA